MPPSISQQSTMLEYPFLPVRGLTSTGSAESFWPVFPSGASAPDHEEDEIFKYRFILRTAMEAASQSIASSSHLLADQFFLLAQEAQLESTDAIRASLTLEEDLSSYARLVDGWDGPDSKAPPVESVDLAFRLLELFPKSLPNPKAMISSSGEIGLYWNLDQTYADVVVENGDEVSIFVRAKDTGAEKFIPVVVADGGLTRQLKEVLVVPSTQGD